MEGISRSLPSIGLSTSRFVAVIATGSSVSFVRAFRDAHQISRVTVRKLLPVKSRPAVVVLSNQRTLLNERRVFGVTWKSSGARALARRLEF